MPNFDTARAARAFIKSAGAGYALSSVYRLTGWGAGVRSRLNSRLAVITPVEAPRAYAVALATVVGGRGVEAAGQPAWFSHGTSVPVEKLEAAFAAVDAASWARFLAYVESGYGEPEYGAGEYGAFLAANGLPPAFTGAAEAYLESLAETFLGD